MRKGGIYMVTERCQDGWFKGTSNRTQKCGVFPGNYVAPAKYVYFFPNFCIANVSTSVVCQALDLITDVNADYAADRQIHLANIKFRHYQTQDRMSSHAWP